MNELDDPAPRTDILPPEDEAALVDLRYRHDGWTAGKQRQFLAGLGETGCIRDACRMVGMSKTSAYRLRDRSVDFAAAWDRALTMAGTVLEQIAFERAVTGIEEEVWHYGKHMGTRRRYSDSLLRLLILRGDLRGGAGKSKTQLEQAAREAAHLAGGQFVCRVTAEDTNRALIKALDGAKRRMVKANREHVERLLIEGKVP